MLHSDMQVGSFATRLLLLTMCPLLMTAMADSFDSPSVFATLPHPSDENRICLMFEAKLSGSIKKLHEHLGRHIDDDFSPAYGISKAYGLCSMRDDADHVINSMQQHQGHEDPTISTAQRLTIKFLPIALDGGQYWWFFTLQFRVNANRTEWHLDDYNLLADYPRPGPFYREEVYMSKPRNTRVAGKLGAGIPMGRGLACSRVVLPLHTKDLHFKDHQSGSGRIVLTDLRVVAFSNLTREATADAFTGMDFHKCHADERFWQRAGALALIAIGLLLSSLLCSVLGIYLWVGKGCDCGRELWHCWCRRSRGFRG